MVNMQSSYPEYARIAAKAKNLNALAYNLNTVRFQDSVQRIARMTEAERNRLVNGIIAELQLREQKEKDAEAIRLQQYYNSMGRRNTLSDPTAKAQWYFYNPATVTQGIGEFQVKWGRRALEDNWRRKNKGTAELAMAAENTESDARAAGTSKIQDIHTPGYYLQNVPLTDSLMRASHRTVEESLYAAGYIYNNDFQEYALSAEQYEDLIRRYPQSEYAVPSHYYLYRLYGKLDRAVEAENHKNRLLAEAPESIYAKIVLDPSYLDKLAQQKGESEQLYEQAYTRYNNAEYQSVIGIADSALQRFPKDALAPKFAYLKALSTGKLAETGEAMRSEMKKITTDYGGSDIAAEAQNLIDFIDGKEPAMKQAVRVERAKSLYAYSEAGACYFGWMVDARENINQLSFDLLNFNLDHFLNVKLDLTRNNIDDERVLLMIKGFADLQRAQGYYRAFAMEPGLMKNVKYEQTIFLISENNYSILEQDKKIEDYLEFFKKEYLKN
jgi:outer membrane protein assembly factor BamD (BamD/ComL family)